MSQPLTDVEWIFVVLAALYLIEAVPWIRPGCAPFSSMWGRFRSARPTPRAVGNDAGGLHAFGPAPFDATFIAESVPVAIAPQGVFGYAPASPLEAERPPLCHAFFQWPELERLSRRDRELFVGETRLCRLRCPAAAARLAEALRELAATPEGDRPEAVRKWVASTFDLEATRADLARWRSVTGPLRFSATLLFLWIFPLGLARYYGLLPGPRTTTALLLYLGGFFLLWWWTNWQLYRSHRRLHPAARAARWKTTFTAFISPAVPLRGADHLARQQYALVHPSALAAALSPSRDLEETVAVVLRDLRYPRLPETPRSAPAEAASAVDRYRQMQLESATQMAHELGLDPDVLLAPPRPENPESLSYCPRCVQEFTWREARCDRCGGRPTVPF